MNRKPGLYASGVILLFLFALTAWAWILVPTEAQIPVHWNASGIPDRFAGKFLGLFGLPALAAAFACLFVLIPAIEPRRRHLSESVKPYTVTWVALLALVAVLQSAAVLYALGSVRPAEVIGLATLGAVFAVIGNYLGKVRSNFMFGIRTPWTLASEVSWNRTHRLSGRLFVLLGTALIVAALFRNGTLSAFLLVGGLALIVLVAFIYSYFVWRGDAAKQVFGR